jgi:hypothetical protein
MLKIFFSKPLIIVAVGLYILSLFFPAILYQATQGTAVPPDYGWQVLLFGVFGVMLGQYAWLANACAFLSVIFSLSKDARLAAVLSYSAFIVGIHSFFFLQIPLDEGVSAWKNVESLGIGFYIWELAFLILFLQAFWDLYSSSRSNLKFIITLGAIGLAVFVVAYIPVTKPSDNYFLRLTNITSSCNDQGLSPRLIYSGVGCGGNFGPKAPRGWFYGDVTSNNEGKFHISLHNFFGDSIVCNEVACPHPSSKTLFFNLNSDSETFPKAENLWSEWLPIDKDIPLNAYDVYFFDTNTRKVVKKEDNASSIFIDYSFAEGPGFTLPSENFSAYWVGKFVAESEKHMSLKISHSWSEVRVILDGRIIFKGSESGSTQNVTFKVSKGEHILEIEYKNNWHTTNFSAELITIN